MKSDLPIAWRSNQTTLRSRAKVRPAKNEKVFKKARFNLRFVCRGDFVNDAVPVSTATRGIFHTLTIMETLSTPELGAKFAPSAVQ
jgi:hypothetical protein